MSTFPKLETAELILRQFQENDLENVYRGLSHPDIIKYYGVQYNSLEETQDQLLWFKSLEIHQTGIWWAVCNKSTRDFLGAIGFNDLNKMHKKVELGFWLLPQYWGKGIIKEAANVICNYAFENLDVNRIEAFVESENQNSKNALTKLAFEYEGTMRNCEIKNKRTISLAIYSKLKPITS